jgi:hypothetical protein
MAELLWLAAGMRCAFLSGMMTMQTFWRVQPSGLGVDHYSETSSGERADGLHVLDDERRVLSLDCGTSLRMARRAYGDEIVEIEAPRAWDNGDVEGVCVDPTEARIVTRYTWAQFLSRRLGREIGRATERAFASAATREDRR